MDCQSRAIDVSAEAQQKIISLVHQREILALKIKNIDAFIELAIERELRLAGESRGDIDVDFNICNPSKINIRYKTDELDKSVQK